MNSIDLFHQNLAEIKVSYSHKIRPSEMKKVSCSRDAYEALLNIWDGQLDHIEYFYIILLNRANKIMGYYQLSKGGQCGTVADPKCVFQVALKCCSASIILAHNHPSGNTKPSEADIQLTRKMKEAGNMLDLPVLDHLILSSESYFSFADEGIL
ncbi:MAG: JAB domain-containing protein [Bacteroidetes bacterium]|nr:JAB domain-containing protein [Bacteroidota bacterium]